MMDSTTLERWLWRAASSIRGPANPYEYKDYILPLVFYKRLDDVYTDELLDLSNELNSPIDEVKADVKDDRELVRFYIPDEARWDNIRRTTTRLGERLTSALRQIGRENTELQGVIARDRLDFNATAQNERILDDNTLAHLIQILSEHRLGLHDVEPDILGRAYEYLLRRFAEHSSAAGEFFTPETVGHLIARIIGPEAGERIYDPAAGSAGLLIKSQLHYRKLQAQQGIDPEDDPDPLRLFGQEIKPDNVATSKMNAFIHNMDAHIELGDTIRRPRLVDATGALQQFDKVVANPMWNQTFAAEVYKNDTYRRFARGIPPRKHADWGWIQHMISSLKPGGRMAVVLDTGAATRGSGNQGRKSERDIRKAFVDEDMVEAVILLPDNLFFKMSASGIIIVMHRTTVAAPRQHSRETLLINATTLCCKGSPKNYLDDEHIEHIADIVLNWKEVQGISKIAQHAEVASNDYNLSPPRYVSEIDVEPPLPLEDALVQLQDAEEARRDADERLDAVLRVLGFGNWRDS